MRPHLIGSKQGNYADQSMYNCCTYI